MSMLSILSDEVILDDELELVTHFDGNVNSENANLH